MNKQKAQVKLTAKELLKLKPLVDKAQKRIAFVKKQIKKNTTKIQKILLNEYSKNPIEELKRLKSDKVSKKILTMLFKNEAGFIKQRQLLLATAVDNITQRINNKVEEARLRLIKEEKEIMDREVLKIINKQTKSASKVISRQETATFESAKEYEVANKQNKKKKIWICQEKNSRDTHLDISGTIVDIDEEFILETEDGGTERCNHPRDASLSAGNTINCACYVIYTD